LHTIKGTCGFLGLTRGHGRCRLPHPGGH
jgi:hypothetical protein